MLHCNGIDPFITLMGNFNLGPISRNDIVSRFCFDRADRSSLFDSVNAVKELISFWEIQLYNNCVNFHTSKLINKQCSV